MEKQNKIATKSSLKHFFQGLPPLTPRFSIHGRHARIFGQIFDQIFGKVFEQIFDQDFDQGFGPNNTEQCTVLLGRRNTKYIHTGTEKYSFTAPQGPCIKNPIHSKSHILKHPIY